VDQKQIDIWAKETEVSPDGPAARRGGKWQVTAAKFRSRDEALALNRSLRVNGYPAEVRNADAAYAVVVGGLAGEAEARALMSSLREFPGVLGPTVQGP
jgi:cell division septation protein DedD